MSMTKRVSIFGKKMYRGRKGSAGINSLSLKKKQRGAALGPRCLTCFARIVRPRNSRLLLVADRARRARCVRNTRASVRSHADRRASVQVKLHHTRLIIAERAHTSRLISGRSSVDFEPVVDARVGLGSRGIKRIAALGEWSHAQQRVD